MDDYWSSVVSGALGDLRARSKNRVYESDPQAWLSDVLGKRWYSKQLEIAEGWLANTRTAVKSANGCGKSSLVADLITWIVATRDLNDTLCIVSAPTLSQIEKVIFAYLKVNKGLARTGAGLNLPGRITEQLEWKLDTPDGANFLVFGKRPADKDIVSSFQGTRKLNTFVFLDEAGGLPQDMFTAAEAVITSESSKIMAIGNPDHRGTEFHRTFTDERISQDWHLASISAFDLPTFTGEKVYSDESAQQQMLSGLTSIDWVEHKRRAWGEDSARWKSKVLGEFPGEADNTFYSQTIIDAAYDTDLSGNVETVRPVLGLDVARYGSDENRLYINYGGYVRQYDDGTETGGAWSKTDLITTARKVHAVAQTVGASLVNVDVNGVGGGVVDALVTLEEFSDAVYDVGAIAGSNAAPDNTRWGNARAWHYDSLRDLMAGSKIDFDYNDEALREQLITQTYKFNPRGSILITSKDEMKKHGLNSPDSLDAAILSVIEFKEAPVEGPQPGEVIEYDIDEVHPFYSNNVMW
jgi:hypothetical protein